MTPAQSEEFPRAVREIAADERTRVVILTANGPSFCAGGDLATIEGRLDRGSAENERYLLDFYSRYLTLLALEVPVIAAINGHAIGAGVGLALACDVRFAARGAKLGLTFVDLALHPGMATLHLLPLVVGEAHAADLILTGRLVQADEALAMGLVDRVVPDGELMDAALEYARRIAAKPGTATRTAKKALAARKTAGLEVTLARDAALQAQSFASREMREAIAAVRRPA
jgi:enoyl-CoA hydratase